MAIHYRLSTGPGAWTQQFAGLLDLEGPPSLYNLGDGHGGDFFQVNWGIRGTFSIGATTYTFVGPMRIQDQGAGLWDTTFAVPVSSQTGQQYTWESTNGAFFTADGSPYPSAQGASSIAYSLYPEKILFHGSGFRPSLNLGTGTLVAERICSVEVLDHLHLEMLENKITELSKALAQLGKGTELNELLRIIRQPGYTTPAEFAFSVTILDSMQTQVTALHDLSTQLLAASKLVAPEKQVPRT